MNPAAYLPTGMTIETMIVGMTAISAFLVIVAIWRTMLVRDPMASRLKSLSRPFGSRDQSFSIAISLGSSMTLV